MGLWRSRIEGDGVAEWMVAFFTTEDSEFK